MGRPALFWGRAPVPAPKSSGGDSRRHARADPGRSAAEKNRAVGAFTPAALSRYFIVVAPRCRGCKAYFFFFLLAFFFFRLTFLVAVFFFAAFFFFFRLTFRLAVFFLAAFFFLATVTPP